MSRKARVLSSSQTLRQGMVPLMMRQKMQSESVVIKVEEEQEKKEEEEERREEEKGEETSLCKENNLIIGGRISSSQSSNMVVFISPPFAYNRSTRSVPKITLPFVTIFALIALSWWWWLVRKDSSTDNAAFPSSSPSSFIVNPIILNSSAINTLVIVPCHSAYFGENWDDASLLDDRNWWVFDNQKNQIEEFLRHLEYGVRVAAKLDSLLVFSGGQTRPIGPFSESQSYWNIARHKGWFGYPDMAARATTEEFALDSFDNLFYSICRFKEVTSKLHLLLYIIY